MSDMAERAKEALEGVTDGPWRAVHVGNIHWGVSNGEWSFPTIVKAQCSYDGYGSGSSQANAEFIAAARTLVPELVAELERLHSWDGLMELLDEHWPEDIFPTMPDTDRRDPGPRIVSLLRMVDRLRAEGADRA